MFGVQSVSLQYMAAPTLVGPSLKHNSKIPRNIRLPRRSDTVDKKRNIRKKIVRPAHDEAMQNIKSLYPKDAQSARHNASNGGTPRQIPVGKAIYRRKSHSSLHQHSIGSLALDSDMESEPKGKGDEAISRF